jgi:outer membrane receptor protein involved in Fe transport
MNTAKSLVRAIVLLLAIFVSGVAWAQTSNGTLVGSVVDPTGAVLPKATISAVSSQYGQPHETHTDQVGTYRLESLQPGIYAVTITAPGFETLTVTGVIINGSLTATINGKLKLAAAQEAIEVQAPAAEVIDTESGQLGENISQVEVAQLPYSSLNPAELAMTLPGVHDTPQGQGAVNTYFTNGIAFSVNGTRPRSNNFLIDGQDDNDYMIAGQAFQPVNVGTIQEVAILTNAYSAEFGRGGGSVTNYIYKSGTNNFHGDLWEINRNSALAAIPAQDQVSNSITKNPYDNENIFGFDVGGPLKKDKLFVFGAAQWDRERSAATGPVFNLPTAAGIATLKSLEPNANISLFLDAIGSLISPGLSGVQDIALGNGRPPVEIGLFQVQNVRTVSNGYDWNYRMDWHIRDIDTFTGSYIGDNFTLMPDNFTDPNALPGFQTQQGGPAQIARGQWLHTLSSKIVNEFRFSYTKIAFSYSLLPATAANPLSNIPWIEFGSDINFPSIGIDHRFPQGRSHKTYQVQESFSYASGRHALKGGVDVTHIVVHDGLPLNQRGTIEYNFGGGYTSLGNFVDDWTGQSPGSISKSTGNSNLDTSATIFAPYIEDTWRVKDNLALNLGLRYEYWGTLANVLPYPAMNIGFGFGVPAATDPTTPGLFNAQQVADKRNFAPRIGLAYTPHWGRFLFGDGKTVLRAGYGIFYDGLFSNIVDNTAESAPNIQGGIIPSQVGRGTMNASTFPGLGLTTIFSMASNLHNPLTQQWNVDVQRDLPLGLVMTLAYVGTRGEHLYATQDFNPQVLFSFTNPNFGAIGVRTNAGDSRYDSGQVEVERKIHSGLILRAAYTYSKFMDDTSEIFTTTGLSSVAQVLTNQRSDWGPSAFDQRHRFSVAYVWKVPYFHHNAFLRALTDQWQWSGIATIETGTPNTVSVGFDNIGNGVPNSRPDLGSVSAPLNSFGYVGGDVSPPGQPYDPNSYYEFNCINAWFGGGPQCPAEPASTFHFIVPNTVPGNVGRNSLFGPGQIYFDTAIQRDFPIHFWKLNNQTLSFRTDMFNAFNHPNLFTPLYNMSDINFNNTAITINGGRQIKFWLKYSF